jgi:hypothetical protein
MGSAARKAFGQNCDDIDLLLEIHGDLGGDAPGRRRRLEVLNKSAIVLITAVWEAYCEDIVAEGLRHLVEHAPSADALPKELRKQVLAELASDKDELAIWRMRSSAGVMYRSQMSDSLSAVLSTPASPRGEEPE